MASPEDLNGTETPPQAPRRTARHEPHLPWLPMPKAPANDNERELVWIVRGFFARHINWLIPTLMLAAFSLALLIVRS